MTWCTKYRHAVLKDAIEVELKRILAETCRQYEWKLQSLEIMPDHVHIFLQTDPTTAPVEIAKEGIAKLASSLKSPFSAALQLHIIE